MNARAILLAMLPLSVALAGCAVEPPLVQGNVTRPGPGSSVAPGTAPGAADPGDLTGNVTPDAIVLQAPLWVRGDSWRFNIQNGDGSGGAQHFVVYGETPTDYLLATTEAEDAITQAYFTRSLPGRVNKQFLSGYDQGIGTRYLDFPLQQNKTWNLHVRGNDFAMRANFSRSVDGKGPGFLMDGASFDGTRISLAYAPQAKWMTRFQLLSPEGTNIFQRTLTAYQANYTGPYYTARIEELYQAERNGTAPGQPPLADFSQGRPYTALRMTFEAQGQGAIDVRILDPAGQLQYNFTGPPTAFSTFEQRTLPSIVGGWRVAWNMAGPVEATLRIAGADATEGAI